MPVQTPDGTIYGANGKVRHFSVQRFRKDVVEGSCCFMCGRTESESVIFNAEHIIPQWILSRYKLYHSYINLTNGGRVRYDQYTVPCCKDCNQELGKKVEMRVQKLLCQGYDCVVEQLTPELEALIYCWCALLFLKLHLKDRAVRMDQDRRKADVKIGDFHDWGALHHVQSIARCPIADVGLGHNAVGSLIIKKVKMHAELAGRYDQGDITLAYTSMVQIDDIGIIAVMDDAKLCEQITQKEMAKLGTLHPLQLREVLVHVAYTNSRIEHRPTFRTTLEPSSGKMEVEIEDEKMPDRVTLEKPDPEKYGKMLDFAMKDVPLLDEIRKDVRAGKRSFVIDESGEFVDMPLPPA